MHDSTGAYDYLHHSKRAIIAAAACLFLRQPWRGLAR